MRSDRSARSRGDRGLPLPLPPAGGRDDERRQLELSARLSTLVACGPGHNDARLDGRLRLLARAGCAAALHDER